MAFSKKVIDRQQQSKSVGDIVSSQIEQFASRLLVRERSLVLDDFAELAVVALDCVGG
jgi:hypothetical protein